MYQVNKKKVKANLDIFFIDIHQIDGDFEKLLNDRIASICEGNFGSSTATVKKRIANFLETKKNSNLLIGAIAEFFVHLIITDFGYKQECMFSNLEENSIKKGFDGYYSFDKLEWIMESKSGSISSKVMSHKLKIAEAYSDLREKLAGKTTNNPWRNAYNHASHKDINTDENILSHIKTLSEDFEKGKFYNISDFNIMPASTIFLENKKSFIDKDKAATEIKEHFAKVKMKKVAVFCVTQRSVKLFLDYLAL